MHDLWRILMLIPQAEDTTVQFGSFSDLYTQVSLKTVRLLLFWTLWVICEIIKYKWVMGTPELELRLTCDMQGILLGFALHLVKSALAQGDEVRNELQHWRLLCLPLHLCTQASTLIASSFPQLTSPMLVFLNYNKHILASYLFLSLLSTFSKLLSSK